MSTLLDAKSTTVTVGNGTWTKGWNSIDRMCGTEVFLADYCGPDESGGIVVGDATRKAEAYAVRPFAIIADLDRSPMCSQSDDEDWLTRTLKDAQEQTVGRALCTPHAAGSETWIGDAAVTQAADLAAGRSAWLASNVGRPTLHVAGDIAAANAGTLIQYDGKEPFSAWGDEVVIGDGYIDGTAFWSGPIAVYLSSIDTSTLLSHVKNLSVVQSNQVGAIDVAPCTIVRIGATPVDPSPIP